MNRRRIEASEIFSIPESASLDTLRRVYPGSVEASMLDQDGDPYLRIASSKSEKDSDGMDKEGIQKKIEEWKKHNKEYATSAGFRKANKGRGPMDPRRFALQLAEVARLNAGRYRSPSLLRLAKKLKWVAGQERGVAARALAKIAAPLEEEARRRDETGMPFIQKPPDQDIPPSTEFNPESRLTPGEPIDYSRDDSWRTHEASRKTAKENEIDSELVTMARDFLQDYKSQNSLYDQDLLEQLQDPEVFESWILDLDSKGVKPDSGQLDEAWNAAMGEIAEGSGGSLEEELGEDLSPISAARDIGTTQPYTAPGGDWSNTVINMHENPTMDRYLRTMKDKREGRKLTARKIEVEGEIAEAVDQCLDHFAGDMLPSEISSDHVRDFIEDKFSDVDWKKVYEAIQKISDPKKRHEEEPKERTNQEASRKRTAGFRDDAMSYSHSDLVDLVEYYKEQGKTAESITPKDIANYLGIGIKPAFLILSKVQQLFGRSSGPVSSRKSGLKRHREICACCKGTGERGERCCGQCHGSGQTDVSAFDQDLDRKEKMVARLGGLTLVSVDVGNRNVSGEDRRELARLTGSRVASKGSPLVFKHSTGLMKVLVEHGIPYRTVSYRHPRYQK